MAYIFEPIFLYQLGYSLIDIMIFYAIVYAAYSVFVFGGAKMISKIGYKHAILISNIFYIIYWIALYHVQNYESFFFVAPFFFALQKSFFWPAINADMALNSTKVQGGREVGMLFSLIQIVSIVGPFLGGFISYQFGFLALFSSSAAIMLFSSWPLFFSQDIYMQHRFRFKNFWTVFKKHVQNFFAYWGYSEDLMLMSLWPVFVFLTIPDVLGVGTVITVASALAAMLMLYIGRLSDYMSKRDLLQLTSWFYALTWIFRFLARSVGSVLTFEVFTRLGKGITNVPLNSLTFEIAGAKKADYAIAYNVFYEFSLSIGKIITALLAIAILSFGLSIHLVFVMAGALTLFYGLLKK
ncbi:MAG: MFS transporter [Candidatus Doudnabacteria bacterium]|nr:MFS transporter [Candidatus Doudnabacteria bacterium]